jgi:ABC-type phosphate transport system substrate-binding protein
MRLIHRLILLIAASLLGMGLARAEVVVVVDANSGIDQLTQDQVINIYLGRHRKLPSGIAALPVDQPASENLRAEFYRKLVDKDLSEINAYWARLHFSGKTSPPIQAAIPGEVLKHVIDKPGGIGYIDRSKVDARVRIVLAFPP